MPQILFLPDGRTVEASISESILSASLGAGIPHTNECRGNARCSTCRVLILNGLEFCCPRNEKEQALAAQLHFAERVRLAFQTTILGNVAVRRLILDANDAGLTDQRKDTTTHGAVGEEREIAILFVDVRNSTRFADSVPAFDVIHVLRRFYNRMDKAVIVVMFSTARSRRKQGGRNRPDRDQTWRSRPCLLRKHGRFARG